MTKTQPFHCRYKAAPEMALKLSLTLLLQNIFNSVSDIHYYTVHSEVNTLTESLEAESLSQDFGVSQIQCLSLVSHHNRNIFK